MKNNNKLVIILTIIIICLLSTVGFLTYKVLADDNEQNTQLPNEEITENDDEFLYDVTLTFVKFAIRKKWEISNRGLDYCDQLTNRCYQGITVETGENFHLELGKLENIEEGKKKFQSETEHDDDHFLIQELLVDNKNNYNQYEAIRTSKGYGAIPAGLKDYIYRLRIDNYNITVYAPDINSSKDVPKLRKIVEELKEALEIK